MSTRFRVTYQLAQGLELERAWAAVNARGGSCRIVTDPDRLPGKLTGGLVLTEWSWAVPEWSGRPAELAFTMELGGRCFPWPSDNVTFGRHVYAAHYRQLLEGFSSGAAWAMMTLRHEFTHGFQYLTRGYLWVLTHPTAREAEARANQEARGKIGMMAVTGVSASN